MGASNLNEFRFIDPTTFQPDPERLEELEYNGSIRRLIIERVRNDREVSNDIQQLVTKKQNLFNAARGETNNLQRYGDPQFPANQPTQYDNSGVADDYGRNLWNMALQNNYAHWMDLTSTRNGRTRNFVMYQIGKTSKTNAPRQQTAQFLSLLIG